MTSTATRPPTRDHLKKKRPMEVVVPIHHNDTTVEAYEKASDELARAELLDQVEDLPALKEAKAAAAEALADDTTFLTFRALGRKAYEELLTQHPATPEERAEALAKEEPEPAYNQETFSVALVAASCIEEDGTPVWTEDEARDVFDEWNQAEIVLLWSAALTANAKRRVTDLGNSYGSTRGSGKS
jgi:hypothetical protein